MAFGCENKGGMVRRVNMSKSKVVSLVPPLLPKPKFVNSVVAAKRSLAEERQRLLDHRCVVCK